MKLIIFATVIAISSAAQLPSNVYLPQNQGSARPPSNFHQAQSQGSSFQGSYQQSSFGQSSYQGSSFGGSSGSGDNGNRRPQQETEKNAAILKQSQDANENGFHYSYETSNGIRAEESGNAAQTQGGYSYKGDDGSTYTIVFTAGEGGFRPQGDHIPVPPPTPEAILKALDQNAKDEAAGIFDDGKYKPEANGQNPGHSGSGFASGQTFGSANHQGTFNGNSGYRY